MGSNGSEPVGAGVPDGPEQREPEAAVIVKPYAAPPVDEDPIRPPASLLADVPPSDRTVRNMSGRRIT